MRNEQNRAGSRAEGAGQDRRSAVLLKAQSASRRSRFRSQFHAPTSQPRKSLLMCEVSRCMLALWEFCSLHAGSSAASRTRPVAARRARGHAGYNPPRVPAVEHPLQKRFCGIVVAFARVLHPGSDDSEFFLFDINIAQAKQDNRARRRKTIDAMLQRCRNGWYPSRASGVLLAGPGPGRAGQPQAAGSTVAGPRPKGDARASRDGAPPERVQPAPHSRQVYRGRLGAGRNSVALPTGLAVDVISRTTSMQRLPVPTDDGFTSQFVWGDTWYEGKHEPIFSAGSGPAQAVVRAAGAQRKLKHLGLFANGPLMLTCSVTGCGCKVTYAPKDEAAPAVTYHYYRCSDGKSVHARAGEPQVNVQEGTSSTSSRSRRRRHPDRPGPRRTDRGGLNESRTLRRRQRRRGPAELPGRRSRRCERRRTASSIGSIGARSTA